MMLRMPKIGMEMTDGTLARWLAEEGAVIEKGEPLYEIETDKVTTEIEAPAAGRLRRIALEGVTYAVGDPLAELIDDK